MGNRKGQRRAITLPSTADRAIILFWPFSTGSKYVIHLWNRSGNVTSWNNILAFFDASYERIREHIKVLGVIADSGFYLKQFIERLEEEHLTYIIAVRLIRPIQRQIYALTNWKEITKGLAVSEFPFMHPPWGRERRYIVVRQNIIRRKKATGKTLPLFAHEVDLKDYRFSVWITNSKEEPYEVWTMCKPRANDENTIKELKEDFALGGFSMKRFYAVEAAMVLRALVYNLFVLFRHEFLGIKEKRQHLKTLRYKYFVLPAQMGRDGREAILRISQVTGRVRAKISYLLPASGAIFHRLISTALQLDIHEATETGGEPRNRTGSGHFEDGAKALSGFMLQVCER